MQLVERIELRMEWGNSVVRQYPGEGPPVVLLHPLALDAKIWDMANEQLPRGRAAIALDLRGHGESTWNGAPFTIDDMAADVVTALRYMDVDECDVVGMSMGGCVGLGVAARSPDLVRRVVLCDTTAWYGPDAMLKWEERARSAEQRPRHDLIAFQVDRWFTQSFRDRCGEVVQRTVDSFVSTDRRAHAQACRALGLFDARPVLANIRSKAFVVTGEEDYATPPQMGKDLARGISGARFAIWKEVRHFPLLESSSLRRAVARFLSAHC